MRAILIGALLVFLGGTFDLPVEPPTWGPTKKRTAATNQAGVTGQSIPVPPSQEDGPQAEDDPRDVAPPLFYGEAIGTESDELVYVVDLSGSMDYSKEPDNSPLWYVDRAGNLARGTKGMRAREELIRSVNGLAETFRFSVVAFDHLPEAWSSTLLPATRANKDALTAWIDGCFYRNWLSVTGSRFGGNTATGPAVVAALELGADHLVVLTDGAPNTPWSDPQKHRDAIKLGNRRPAVIDVFGIEARGSWRLFCQQVAQDSGGSYHDVR